MWFARGWDAALAEVEEAVGELNPDELMYDHPVAMSGEPMDPELFVQWSAVLSRLDASTEGSLGVSDLDLATPRLIEYDEQERWLVETDGDGASRIVARDVARLHASAIVAAVNAYDRLREAVTKIADWQTHGPLLARDAEAMVALARAALDPAATEPEER